MSIPLLSKSKFIAGMQCPLRLWYSCYEPELATPPTPGKQAIFDNGTRVGELARDLYPGGVLIEEEYDQHEEAIRSTERARKDCDAPAIYEAAFASDGVRIRADVLERSENGSWNLIEVKSGTRVKDDHVYDVAIQHNVLDQVGLDLKQAGILHLNKEYLYDGENLDLMALFVFNDLKGQVIDMQAEVEAKLRDLKAVLTREYPPEVGPSRHCSKPYDCEFYDHCKDKMPDHWVLQLSGIGNGKLSELALMGVHDIEDVPESFHLSPLQARIRDCVLTGTEYIGPRLKAELKERNYPIHFLDFETISPPIPRYANTHPYQTLPFQWSDHILLKGGILDHKGYLCDEDKDPREEVARTLLETLGERGDIATYTTYEKTVISSLANDLPQHREELLALLDRCWDLKATIKENYYHPEFHGSFSLKSVLPGVVPSMSYEEFTIQDGDQAGVEYLRMIDPQTPSDEKERIRRDLLEYCGQDTFGLVQIREALLRRSSG